MLTHRVRDIVAFVIIAVAVSISAVASWSWATESLAESARTAAEAAAWEQPEPSSTTIVDQRGKRLDALVFDSEWVEDVALRVGIDETTAEKATVGLYGAIVGGLVGGALAFIFSEPIARVLTIWPNRRKRARLVV